MRGVTVPAAVAALALVVPATLLTAAPALAGAVFVEANPSTVAAGDDVGLRASCADNTVAATVTSEAFGTATVSPRYGFLTAIARVPAGTRADDYRVRLRCADGATATATLYVVARERPRRGPATGGGGMADDGDGAAPLLLTGGLAALGGAAVVGLLSLRRRRSR